MQKKYITHSWIVGLLALTVLSCGLLESSMGQIFGRRNNRQPTRTTTRPSTGSTTQPATPQAPAPEPAPKPAEPVAPPVDPDPAPRVNSSGPQALSPDLLDDSDATKALEIESTGKQYALLIGVNDYMFCQDLNYCVADVTALGERLENMGFNVDLLTTGGSANDAPITKVIRKRLDLLFGKVKKEDMVIVAFSGHGIRPENRSYFCPQDADLEDLEDLISIEEVIGKLNNAGRFRMLLVDACRNDPFEGKSAFNIVDSNNAFTRSLIDAKVPEGTAVLTSCSPGEKSWEDQELEHGVFMHHVLEGLSGMADGARSRGVTNGDVTLFELEEYVINGTSDYVDRNFKKSQKPRASFDLDMPDFVICNVDAQRSSHEFTDPNEILIWGQIESGDYKEALEECQRLIQSGRDREVGYRMQSVVYATRRETRDIARALIAMNSARMRTIEIRGRASDSRIPIKDYDQVVATFNDGDIIEVSGIKRVDNQSWLNVVSHNGRTVNGFLKLAEIESDAELPKNDELARARRAIDLATRTEELDEAIKLLESISDRTLKPRADKMRAEATLMLALAKGSKDDVAAAFAIARVAGENTIDIRHAQNDVKLAQSRSNPGASVTAKRNERMTIDVTYVDHPHVKVLGIDGDSQRIGYLEIGDGKDDDDRVPTRPNTWTKTGMNSYRHNLTGREWIVMIGSLDPNTPRVKAQSRGYRMPSQAEVINALRNGMKSHMPVKRYVWTTSGRMDTTSGQIVGPFTPHNNSDLGIR